MDQEPTKEELQQRLDDVRETVAADPDGDQYDEKLEEMQQVINNLPPDLGKPLPARTPAQTIAIRRALQERHRKIHKLPSPEKRKAARAKRKKQQRARRR